MAGRVAAHASNSSTSQRGWAAAERPSLQRAPGVRGAGPPRGGTGRMSPGRARPPRTTRDASHTRHFERHERWNAREQVGKACRHPASVGEDEHPQTEPPRTEVELVEVVPQQRLAAGEAHLQAAESCGLPQDVLDLFCRQLAGASDRVTGREVDTAVDAVVVATLGKLDVELTESRRDRHISGR